ncbi:VOC family protein [Pannonibacter tanglangensis]|uniref:VOC family protein n=1 Tax=Pannonibacter tanglangensis TaxID=2750084 RepID=A0ABW9ZJK3_9HYPH|nr:VOC family protein [Pannonibacter sp. XCT-34]NBN64117.1 VOC family protein [Pannonibacter sp. XCT-34]
MRGIDHIVVAVRDLAAAARSYEAQGFRLTPVARHPWGTENRLIQLDGAFLELLSVPAGVDIPAPARGAFSFGAFNRDFLAAGEGASMVVLDSTDPAADRAAFEAAGLRLFEPFGFEREATGPDGAVRKVGFDLTFTEDPDAPSVGWFTCRNRYPENFWKPEFQQHGNGVRALAEVILIARDPADHHIFLQAVTGVRALRATSLGIECRTARGLVSILSPVAYEGLYGVSAGEPATWPRIAALRLAGPGVAARRVIAASDNRGLMLILDPA